MGIANILEKHTSSLFNSIWGKIPSTTLQIPIDPKVYNRNFVNFAVVFGLYSVASFTMKCIKSRKPTYKTITIQELKYKYGEHSWVLISQVKYNEQYVEYLAKNEFNLILVGMENDTKQAERLALSINKEIKVIRHQVNWRQRCQSIQVYQELEKLASNYDISILILPKIQFTKEQYNNQNQTGAVEYPPLEVGVMMVRYIGPQLSWRSYQSSIVLPSNPEGGKQKIQKGKGIINGSQFAYDGFGRTLQYELELQRKSQVIVARGSPERAFSMLGKKNVSE